jgi:hypothetical protein
MLPLIEPEKSFSAPTTVTGLVVTDVPFENAVEVTKMPFINK